MQQSPSEMKLLRRAVRFAGQLPLADDLDQATVLEALTRDKKSVGGSIQWVLLEQLGKARIVDGREIPPHIINLSLKAVLQSLSKIR